MRFNVKRAQIEVHEIGGKFYVKHWGCLEPLIKYPADPLTLNQLQTIFTPACCESLDLVEPDRNEKLKQIGQTDPNFKEGE
jgi:hypothetical protein